MGAVPKRPKTGQSVPAKVDRLDKPNHCPVCGAETWSPYENYCPDCLLPFYIAFRKAVGWTGQQGLARISVKH